jgi:hypothetical protein
MMPTLKLEAQLPVIFGELVAVEGKGHRLLVRQDGAAIEKGTVAA